MATPVTLLQLSPTMSKGTIVRWVVKEGQKISAGDILAEIETDKAVMEQETFDDGTVLKLAVAEGSQVEVGALIAVLGEPGEDISALLGGGGGSGPKAAAPAPAKKEEPKPAAAPAASGPPKVNFKPETPANDAGTAALAKLSSGEGNGSNGGRVVASPLARKMAADHGLELARISGSGPGNRIVKRDIERALAGGGASAPAAAVAAAPAAGDVEVPLSGMRATIARRLLESRQQIPSFNLTVEVDATNLEKSVARVRELTGEKITLTHFLIKAMAMTLMRHDWVRTQWVGGKLIRKATANISVAVAIEDGLLTPVIRDAQTKGLVAIAAELKVLAEKARSRKLTEADLSGGTQTISNLGMFGIDHFDAIINPPESTILAIGRTADRAVIRDGAVVPARVFTITMACDHRVVDGAVGAAYLKDLKAALEDPLMMLV